MNEDTTEFKLLSKSKAALLLGIGVEKLNKLINEGRIGFIQITDRIMIPMQQIKLFLSENTIHITNNMEEERKYLVNELRNTTKTTRYVPRNIENYNPLEKFNKAKQEKLNV